MIELRSVSKRVSPFEELAPAPPAARSTPGAPGSATREESRTLRHLAVTGRSGPLRSPFESVIGTDERVRVLDTDLTPWRMICALRIRGASGATMVGTGWFAGPRTVVTAGHCVHDDRYLGGWASTVEVIPGLNGAGTGPGTRPYAGVTTERVSSVDRWVGAADPDFDLGAIHLDEPLGETVGWFGFGALPAEELAGHLVNVSGYPVDRAGAAEQYHTANRVVRVGDRRIFYEIDTYGGQSGAPVWLHEAPGAPPLVIAVHAYGIGGTAGDLGITANSAPRIIPEVHDQIAEWVEQDSVVGPPTLASPTR